MSKKIKNTEPKLDFCDVLIEPALGNVFSRSLVNLNIFRKVDDHITNFGVPIIASNMDSVGTMSMTRVLSHYDCWTTLHKYYTMDDLVRFFSEEKQIILNRTFYSLGITDEDIAKYDQVCKYSSSNIKYICIDIANGYTGKFIEKIKQIKDINPQAFIMAGNVATPSGTVALIKAGVNIVKIGIGPGCFVSGTLISTELGFKKIEDVIIGDMVYTHTGKLKKVTNTMKKQEKEKLININGIKCTKNHEFYVIKKEDKSKINENNIENFAFWIPAEELSDKYMLIKLLK